MTGDVSLRSKRELIEKFIQENLPYIEDSDNIPDEFESFWDKERLAALAALSKEEDLDSVGLQEVIGKYLFSEKKPLRDDIVGVMNQRPSLKERGSTAERITARIISLSLIHI